MTHGVAPSTAAVVLIAAVARNGVIGHAGQLLWRLPEDLRYFRAQTTGCPVIMGRKTWDSLPERFRPLPGRHNLVVTRQAGWAAPGATTAHSLAEAVALAQAVVLAAPAAVAKPQVFVIGGAELYAAALPWADQLLLTEIDADFAGDTHFPAWDRSAFTETRREHHTAAAPNGFGFDFVRYLRTLSSDGGGV